MNLRQAEEYLLDLELFGMRFGLDRMHKLMTALGMPQRRFASIHVVGTNGKSSTVRFIAGILERHGIRTGSYTSPHLVSFTERIEVGCMIHSRITVVDIKDQPSPIADACRYSPLVVGGNNNPERVGYCDRVLELFL